MYTLTLVEDCNSIRKGRGWVGEQPAGGLATCAIGLASGQQHLSGIRASAYTVCRTARTVLVCMYRRMFKVCTLNSRGQRGGIKGM